MVSCERPVINDSDYSDYSESSEKTKKFTFTLKGDFSGDWKPVTRGYLSADGKDLTDVWVLDYMGDNLVQQLHQDDNTAADFGKPILNLAYGSHHVYFIASRGSAATLNTDAKTISFSKVLDTFWQDYEVTVVSTSNGNRAVTLDRVVTKLSLIIEDAIPTTAAMFMVTPAKWYYGLNYQTGTPVAAATNQPITLNIPSSSLGKSGESANVFGFSLTDEWQTDVTFSCLKADGSVLGTATINDVPFKANCITEYAGKLFTSDGEQVALSLNSDWNEKYYGVW